MKCNVGKTDRMIRIWLGGIILAVHYISYFVTGYYCVWANIAWIPLITGLMRWCPVYVPFKFSTVKEGEE